MSSIDIAITESNRQQIGEILEVFLASQVILDMKIRNYHWNVQAINFSELHSFFEDIYDASAESIDEIAERIRMLGFQVTANYAHFLAKSFLDEEIRSELSSQDMISNLLADIQTTIVKIREGIHQVWDLWDVGTEDFLTAMIQAHEKNAWKLRSMIL